MTKSFASTGDTQAPEQILEVVANGVYALTAGGDPTLGAIEGADCVLCFEAGATPKVARAWMQRLRERTDKPARYLVLSHYHAVRTLGAAGIGADVVVASEETARLIRERGQQDWDSEFGRMPRLFDGADEIPGLTHPTLTFPRKLTLELGGPAGTVVLMHLGRGHTSGDIVAWLPGSKTLLAGDLVESEAALYTGDAYHLEWPRTLDAIAALGAHAMVCGRGPVVRGEGVGRAIEQTRAFLTGLTGAVKRVMDAGGTLEQAFAAAHEALAPRYGGWPIFEHCLPFDVARAWDEIAGESPRVWTDERDQAIWARLQS